MMGVTLEACHQVQSSILKGCLLNLEEDETLKGQLPGKTRNTDDENLAHYHRYSWITTEKLS